MGEMRAETDFGAVTLSRDGAMFADGGTHGCVGHTLTVLDDGSCAWERRLDSMGDPSDCSGSGTRQLSPSDRDGLDRLLGHAWDLLGGPPPAPTSAESFEPARYQWALVMRRDDAVRTLEGPPLTHPFEEQPAEVAAVREWVYEHVLSWCTEAAAG